ncbi:MAG: 30S ribosomal protein S1 [Bryobacteraceae bacterium]
MASNQNQEPLDRDAISGEEAYEHLLEDYSHLAPPAQGEILHGTILSIAGNDVIVDIGYKSEGMVPIDQFIGPDGQVTVRAGDVIDVMIDHGERPEGYILLSHQKAHRIRIWDRLEEAFQQQQTVTGHVVARTKGGLSVDVGVLGFLPGSQLDPRPVHNLDAFVGQDIPVRIIKLNRRRGNVVLSRKAAIEQDLEQRKKLTLEQLEEGAVLTGTIKNLTDYGAFVDLGGIDGLLHVTDMSHARVNHPSQVVNVGDTVTVKVLKFDREKERVSLGIKQLQPDPWLTVGERFPIGGRVIGKVVNITDYGAFVELEAGVEGLIHISEMTWSRRMKHPSKVVKKSDEVECVVLEVHSDQRRISLGLKQLEPDPWTTLEERYAVGSVVEGRVRNMTDFGAFVEIEEGVDGLVHVSDLSWTKRVRHPSEMLRKGQVVQAVILGIDARNRRLSLGIKQLQPDAWELYFQNHQVGDVVRGRVCRMASFGAFVELAEGVEGLCHNSEIPGYSPRKMEEAPIAIGDEHDFKIIKMSEAEKRIGLSLRAITDDEERTRLEDYQRQAAAATSTIEEVMSLKERGRDEAEESK